MVSLLPGRIPDLKLYRCVIQADGLCKERRCGEERRRWRRVSRPRCGQVPKGWRGTLPAPPVRPQKGCGPGRTPTPQPAPGPHGPAGWRSPLIEPVSGARSPRRARLTADGALLVLVELALDEAQHQAGFPHRRLAQQHQLELTDFTGLGLPVRPGGSSAGHGLGAAGAARPANRRAGKAPRRPRGQGLGAGCWPSIRSAVLEGGESRRHAERARHDAPASTRDRLTSTETRSAEP